MKQRKYRVTGTGECPRCKGVTQERQHILITDKHLSQPFYYTKWYYCYNKECKTTTIMRDEDRIINNNRKANYFREQEDHETQLSFLRNL